MARTLLVTILSLFFFLSHANNIIDGMDSNKDENGFIYYSSDQDPLGTRIYILDNGLTVYLSDYKATPRIQTYVAVRTGSSNDPSDNTGLAHYLEHILFKGTSKIGTSNWEKEEPLLLEIEKLFEQYKLIPFGDTTARKKHYQKIK